MNKKLLGVGLAFLLMGCRVHSSVGSNAWPSQSPLPDLSWGIPQR
jgi:hypothetical protein